MNPRPATDGGLPGDGRAGGDVAADLALLFGGFFAVSMATLVTAGLALLLAGARVAAWWPALGLGAGVAWVALAAATRAGPAARRLGLALAALALAFVAGTAVWHAQGSVFDLSWDGMAYHTEGTAAFAAGWNPVHDPPHGSIWVDSYPKGSWVVAGPLYALTGDIERAKPANLWWTLAAAGLTMWACRALFAWPLWLAALTTVLVAANPVSVTEALNQYIDAQVAGALACFLALSLAIRRHGFRDPALVIAWALVGVAGVDLKFNLAAYLAFALAALLVAGWLGATPGAPRPSAHAFAAASAGIVLLGMALGWNPYVTNVERHGRMAWPPEVTLMRGVRPQGFDALSPPGRFVRSYLSRTAQGPAVPKWPFTVHASERAALREADLYVAGFGPLFSGCVLLGLAALALAARRRPRAARTAALFIGLVTASAFLTGEGWWARFAPQLWWVPLAAALVALRGPAGPAARALAAATLLLMAADSAMLAAIRWPVEVRRSRELSVVLERVVEEHRRSGADELPMIRDYLPRAEHWLGDRGVRVRQVTPATAPPFRERVELPGAYASVLLP